MINEIDVKDHAIIEPYKFSCDDVIDKNIPQPLAGSEEGHFKYLITGKSGSGKTSLVKGLIESKKSNIYHRKFNNVFIISPSIHTQTKKPKLPKNRFYTSLSDLPEILNRIQTEDDLEGRTLIIFDDVANELKQSSPLMTQVKAVLFNNRHLGRPLLDENGKQLESGAVSSMWLVQKYTSAPTWLRSQITHHIIFPPTSKKEIDSIYIDLIHIDRDLYEEILKRVKKKPYNFLFINANKSRMYNGFSKEFILTEE